jgi:hypothetical protein
LKQTAAKLEHQIKVLTAGDLSLLDQEELISRLESRIQIERYASSLILQSNSTSGRKGEKKKRDKVYERET